MTMKLLLWNVNGIRAISKKEPLPSVSFANYLDRFDVVVLNETKISRVEDLSLDLGRFQAFHSFSIVKRGYSGVSILTKVSPIKRIDPTFEDPEGRVVILEFDSFILVGVYVPNSGTKDPSTRLPKRLEFRTKTWDKEFREMCTHLENVKPVIIMGDLNVAHTELDVHAPSRLRRHSGFTRAERDNFGRLLEYTNFIDVWRRRHPYLQEYSYFDYRTKARDRNAGWRIDYVLASKSLYGKIDSCEIEPVNGSDHLSMSVVMC